MFSAFAKAFDQLLSDRAVRRVLWFSLAATTLLLALLIAGVGALVHFTVRFDSWWLSWLNSFVEALGVAATLGLSWILFPAVASGIVGLFLDTVARAVEARHYPGLPPATGATMAESLVASLKLMALMVALNILALPLYLFPFINLFVFYGMNGYLLGREYFELVALRRATRIEAEVLRRSRSGRVVFTGVVITFLMTVPILNLVASVVGTAAMVHLFEGWREHPAPEPKEIEPPRPAG